MGILLAFSPFVVFAIVDRLAGPLEGLVAGALVSAILIVRERFILHHAAKILEVGTFVLFAGLAAYVALKNPDWSIITVRLLVDSGLLVVVLFSMLIGQPFTLQYAREETEPALWGNPEFVRTNYVIAAVWALAFLALVLADLVMLTMPEIPVRFGIIVTVLALLAAVKFTAWYPDR
ncbi:hypothetical protein [Hyphomicrobium sp.]|uniref:hypothetical protein n=1 Tax=Hyphomicrobium sp. TaxID=82 RepID=UPI00356315B8